MISASKRTENFHYAIRNIVAAAEALERDGRKVIYLNIGDPQVYGFRPPAHVVEAVARALRESFTGYAHSSGLMEAREAVAAYATNLGARTAPGEVLMTAGASEAADLLLAALVNEGDEVLLPAPGYPLYEAILNKYGVIPRHYNLDGARGWQLDVAELSSRIGERTRALVIINPNNPTGAIIPDETVKELLGLAARHNLLVIADEVYRDLCFTKQPTPASILAQEMQVPLVTLESLSKTHLIPGWRVGWMRYTCAEKMQGLMQAVGRLASGRLCSPTPTQYAVRPALEGDRSFLAGFIGEIRKRRDLVVAHVNRIEGLSCEVPAAAFYVMIKADDPWRRPDEKFVLDLLAETGVLVVHGSGFGTDPQQGFFRLVYLADEATLDTVFERISKMMKAK